MKMTSIRHRYECYNITTSYALCVYSHVCKSSQTIQNPNDTYVSSSALDNYCVDIITMVASTLKKVLGVKMTRAELVELASSLDAYVAHFEAREEKLRYDQGR